MIEGFRLNNFKAFADSGFIPLSALSCIVGRNSSGKSALINALVILNRVLKKVSVVIASLSCL
jgi:AAA15 family ATPase/GTPase